MVKALLTIDDIASKNTVAIVDYLNKNKIPAIMFAWGENIEKHYENAIYALKNGMIVGNHSYSHPAFSKLSFEQAVEEIEKNELVLDKLYKDAGVERRFRPFRFPYGDKGGNNKNALQDYLLKNGFDKVCDTQLKYDWWKERGLDKDIDTLWTFDFAEYLIRKDSGFTKEDVFRRMEDPTPQYGAALLADGSSHILLLHAHDETEEIVPEYYKLFIERLLEKGVVFEKPEFVKLDKETAE